MAKGTKFVKRRTDNADLNAVQDSVSDFAEQLEDIRRGVMAFPPRTEALAAQLGEDAVSRYTGSASVSWKLPAVTIRGRGRAVVMMIVHGGPSGTLTLLPAGDDRITAPVALSPGQGVVMIGDGFSTWTPVGLGGGGGASGSAVLDFGATPTDEASVAVVGQAGIGAGSLAQAWWVSASTADNGTDEHEEGAALCPLVCGPVTPGVGFTIKANPIAMVGVGQFSVRWRWN